MGEIGSNLPTLVLGLDCLWNPAHLPILIAQRKGYFVKHGVNVRVVEPTTPFLPESDEEPVFRRLRDGHVDVCVAETVQLLQAHRRRKKQRSSPEKQLSEEAVKPSCATAVEVSSAQQDEVSKKISWGKVELQSDKRNSIVGFCRFFQTVGGVMHKKCARVKSRGALPCSENTQQQQNQVVSHTPATTSGLSSVEYVDGAGENGGTTISGTNGGTTTIDTKPKASPGTTVLVPLERPRDLVRLPEIRIHNGGLHSGAASAIIKAMYLYDGGDPSRLPPIVTPSSGFFHTKALREGTADFATIVSANFELPESRNARLDVGFWDMKVHGLPDLCQLALAANRETLVREQKALRAMVQGIREATDWIKLNGLEAQELWNACFPTTDLMQAETMLAILQLTLPMFPTAQDLSMEYWNHMARWLDTASGEGGGDANPVDCWTNSLLFG